MVVGSRTILNDCGTESYAAYENAYQYGAEKRNSTALPFTAAARMCDWTLETAKLTLAKGTYAGVKSVECGVLVHRAAAAPVPSGALIGAHASDLYSYGEVLRPTVLENKYKSYDFDEGVESYACDVGPQACPQATTIIGEDVQGCILACDSRL